MRSLGGRSTPSSIGGRGKWFGYSSREQRGLISLKPSRWYDAHAPQVVPQFRDALRAALTRIGDNPKQFTPVYKETRRALLRRFPYVIVFRETRDAIYVVAVFHTSRDPLIWQRRS